MSQRSNGMIALLSQEYPLSYTHGDPDVTYLFKNSLFDDLETPTGNRLEMIPILSALKETEKDLNAKMVNGTVGLFWTNDELTPENALRFLRDEGYQPISFYGFLNFWRKNVTNLRREGFDLYPLGIQYHWLHDQKIYTYVPSIIVGEQNDKGIIPTTFKMQRQDLLIINRTFQTIVGWKSA